MGEQSRAERLFRLMDKDGDGYVTKSVQNICYIVLYMIYETYEISCLMDGDGYVTKSVQNEMQTCYISFTLYICLKCDLIPHGQGRRWICH